jgi:alkylation response protein AidB-like acyl-CoA dehydrogenase
MDLTLPEDVLQVAAMASDVMLGEASLDRWLRPDVSVVVEEDRLRVLAGELGWIGFGAPEAIGGGGATTVEEVVLFREVGRHLGPISLAVGATAARMAAASGLELAADVAVGAAPVGLVLPRGPSRVWRLGAGSGEIGLAVEGEHLRLVAIEGLSDETCLDPTVSAQTADRQDVRVLAEADAVEARRFHLLVAAQQLGLAEAALAASVAYGKLREQFGRPIGAFQAVRHRCVDMLVRCEKAKAQLWFAAVSLRDGAADSGFQASAALRLCDEAAGANARDNILLHGAIGATAENEGHLFLKRSMLWRQALPRAAVLEEIAAGAGPWPPQRQNALTS